MNTQNSTNALGAAWLCSEYGLELANPLATLSVIGTRRQTIERETQTQEVYQETMRPKDGLRGQLTFHLKHEFIHLEMLSRLFAVIDPQELVDWCAQEPASAYAKRSGFLYEWLSGQQLAIGEMGGNNVDVLDPESVVAATTGTINRRWRVKDNLPGTPEFCPLVRRTSASQNAMAFDCAAKLGEIDAEFGADMLLRSAVWLTMRESKSSFQMEGEEGKKKRIQRFADVIHSYTGTGDMLLTHDGLSMLQQAILGKDTSIVAPGIRKSPVFVGESLRNYEEVVHYVAPPFGDLEPMLAGLRKFLDVTQGQSPVMRSAVAAFGFVYIHPMADGNGRVHRFLINDVLRRDGAVPAPLILPVSGLLTKDLVERRAYDDILDGFSKPLMDLVSERCHMTKVPVQYDDGVTSNFVFEGDAQARHAWRHIDFTAHVNFMARVLEKTIDKEMRNEAQYLQSHYAAREAIMEIIEMPNQQADRVIRSVEQNQGVLSGALVAEIPALAEGDNWAQIVAAVESAFSGKAVRFSVTAMQPGPQ